MSTFSNAAKGVAQPANPGRLISQFAPLAVALLVAGILPSFVDNYWIQIASLACIYWVLIAGLNLIVGYAGQLAIGFVGLLAIGRCAPN